MKKVALLFAVLTILIPLHSALPQTLTDWKSPFISAIKDDTLVVKTLDEIAGEPNALYRVINGDTVNVPAGHVYELQASGWYSLQNNPTSFSKHPTVIVVSDATMVVNNKDALSSPPLISGYTDVIPYTGEINAGGDLTIKNCALIPAAEVGTLG
jgi:hypothetical protein